MAPAPAPALSWRMSAVPAVTQCPLLRASGIRLQRRRAGRGSGSRTVGMQEGKPTRPHMLPQLSPPRPGDRIMLVDDSNEDWWKVTGRVGDGGTLVGISPTSALHGRCPTFSPGPKDHSPSSLWLQPSLGPTLRSCSCFDTPPPPPPQATSALCLCPPNALPSAEATPLGA